MTPDALLGFPVALLVRANRRANIGAGIFLAGVQIATLFVGTPTLAYGFLSMVLIGTSAIIVWYA